MNKEATSPPKKQDKLSRIVDLAKTLLSVQASVKGLEEQLAAGKKLQTTIETEHLPELMRELELTSIKLDNGMQVVLSDEVDCGITVANHEAAIKWLDDHSFGGLIKTKLEAVFSRDDREDATDIAKKLQKEINGREIDASCGLAATVHPSTLKSFIKEQLGAGTAIPFDLFSVRPYSKAKIKKA